MYHFNFRNTRHATEKPQENWRLALGSPKAKDSPCLQERQTSILKRQSSHPTCHPEKLRRYGAIYSGSLHVLRQYKVKILNQVQDDSGGCLDSDGGCMCETEKSVSGLR